MSEPSSNAALTAALRAIREAGQRLIHVKWDREGFALLDQAVREARSLLQDHPEDTAAVAEPLARLERQLGASLSGWQLPQGVDRDHLRAALDVLDRLLPESQPAATDDTTGLPDQSGARGPILLLAGPNTEKLVLELENAGYPVQRIQTLTELRQSIGVTLPAAFIVDMDFPEGAMFAGINMVTDQRDRLDFKAPLFFCSERTDLTTRLEAISAGGQAYFTKPVNVPLLLQTLGQRLLERSANGLRVLIVAENATEGQRVARVLDNRAIVTRILGQPLEVIYALQTFKPQLLVVDLDLHTVNSIELMLALRQHEACDGLPMVLLASQGTLGRYSTALGVGGEEILRKPVNADHLLATVTYRLQWAQSLHSRLSQQAQIDTVSGLFHRRYFLDRLEQVLGKGKPPVGVMLIRLENLHELETRDLTLVDDVIEQAARRLRTVLEPGFLAARLADDLLAVLSSGTRQTELFNLARVLCVALETEAYPIGAESVQAQVSIGLSIATGPEQKAGRLIHQADVACRLARERSAEHFYLYDPAAERTTGVSQRQRFLEDIQEAVQQRHMHLVYQPIASLKREDAVARYEVLLRIRDRHGQELLPESVFDIVQEHRLGLILDRWVIASSIRLLRERRAQNQPTILFVNVSPALLQDGSLEAWLKAGLERTGVQPASLVFEMAEATARQNLKKVYRFGYVLRMLGCGFSLDRFSGQAASYSLLDKLPVKYVKPDPAFIHDLVTDPNRQQALSQLARRLETLQIATLVSCIEDANLLQVLTRCGVRFAQGYSLQRPDAEMNYDFNSLLVT